MTNRIEGEDVKPYALYRTNTKGEPIQRLAEADSEEELRNWLRERQPLDWTYAILHKRKQIWPKPRY